MSDREFMLRSLVSWYQTREVSPAPLNASPKDSALESIQEDSESAQLLGAKVRVNSLLGHPLTFSIPLHNLSSPLPRMLQQEETPYTVLAINSNQTPPIQRL